MPKYTCTICGETMISKNPATRNVFPDDLSAAYLQAISCAEIVDDPQRPPEKGVAYLSNPQEVFDVPQGQDLQLRVTIPNDPRTVDKRRNTPRAVLHSYFKTLRTMSPEELRHYECGLLVGHTWHSDNPPDV